LQAPRGEAQKGDGDGGPPPAVIHCALCDSIEPRTGGWTYAQTFTFTGRVHNYCLDAYRKMKPLWWELYHEPPSSMYTPDDWAGYRALLAKMKVPAADGKLDIHSPEFMVCEHAWRNCGTLFAAMQGAS